MNLLSEQRRASAVSEDEDLYSGYNEYPSGFGSKAFQSDEVVQQALLLNTGHGHGNLISRPPAGTARRLGTSTGYHRDGTSNVLRSSQRTAAQDGGTRPMTAVRGAGYTSGGSRHMFDPLNQASKGPSPALDREDSPEEKIRRLERRVMQLVEESCEASGKGDPKLGLERAKEASSRERTLIRLQEQAALGEAHNIDLTYSVLLNLALQYENNAMYTEALNTYQVMTRNRAFSNASRLKVNMGNIYAHLGQLTRAIKLYRMALDQVPSSHKDLRLRIMHNIGLLFVKMGQYNDACMSFEFIMQENPDFKPGLHLVLCYSALADVEKMKRGFRLLLDVPLEVMDDEDKYNTPPDETGSNVLLEVIRSDSLRRVEREIRQQAERSIVTAAKLLAKASGQGFAWCIEALKASSYVSLAGELELNKAIMFLKQRDLPSAIDTLRVLADSSKMSSAAATNLSFVYFLQGDVENAEKWAGNAKQADGYNAGAFVNLGSCSFVQGEFDRARGYFHCALENDSSCIEALFNLGLTHKRQGNFEEALENFLKLQSIVGHEPQVMYQIANLHELLGDPDQAMEWYQQLLGTVPTDPGILQKIAQLHRSDRQQAFQYYLDSARYYPSNVAAIEWLGSYYVEMQVPEKAAIHYERAAVLQPNEPRWPLLMASCLRRSGQHQEALRHYQTIQRRFPDNVECLRFLVRICSDLGMRGLAAEYTTLLAKAEKVKEVRERIGSSRPGSRRSLGSSRGSSAVATGVSASPTAGPGEVGSGAGSRSVPSSASKSPVSLYTLQAKEFGLTETLLSPLTERPAPSSAGNLLEQDDFMDQDIGQDLLPE